MESPLEDIVYLAYQIGKRDELFRKISELRLVHPRMDLKKLYEMAYDYVKNNVL
jgi:hypothetical protein